ncbi:MAG: hypothetical protein KAS64_03710 [Spirochaetes bacterium]|nr:hypothetical protein [Spirochaetota bacterium]
MLFKKSFIKWALMLTITFSFLMPAYVNASIKSKCRKIVRKLTKKVNGVKKRVRNFKRKIASVDRNLNRAKKNVNRMPGSSRKRKLIKAILNATQRAYRLTKYYLQVNNYHLYVAKRVRKAAKPCSPRKWWKRIKKARKVVKRLIKLAKQIPARLRDAKALIKYTNTIIRNASAVTE